MNERAAGQEVVLERIDEGIVEVRLQREERLNALGLSTCAALEKAVGDAGRHGARVLLLRGSGRAFCAGADLKERRGMDQAARLGHNARINAAIQAVADARFVTIAVLNGLALGGGLELALACDLRFAAPGIALGLPESKVGGIPGAGGTQRLPRLIGVGRALQMMLSGEPVTSEYAHTVGLVNDVWPADELDSRSRAFARLLAQRSPNGLAEIKRLVYEGMQRPLPMALQLEREAVPAVLNSSDYAEGLAAFAERRPPRFKSTLP